MSFVRLATQWVVDAQLPITDRTSIAQKVSTDLRSKDRVEWKAVHKRGDVTRFEAGLATDLKRERKLRSVVFLSFKELRHNDSMSFCQSVEIPAPDLGSVEKQVWLYCIRSEDFCCSLSVGKEGCRNLSSVRLMGGLRTLRTSAVVPLESHCIGIRSIKGDLASILARHSSPLQMPLVDYCPSHCVRTSFVLPHGYQTSSIEVPTFPLWNEGPNLD
jgi:hypothetical protein